MLPFQEAHWQGLELITLTPGMARVLKVPTDTKGVAIDEATMPADLQGFVAGDVILSVNGRQTPTLEAFVAAADVARDQPKAELTVLRKRDTLRLRLSSLTDRLGNANGETAPMIPPGALMPHAYQGACTNCHHIGRGANLAVDLGDPLNKTAPVIHAGQMPPHRNRGTCSACHTIQ